MNFIGSIVVIALFVGYWILKGATRQAIQTGGFGIGAGKIVVMAIAVTIVFIFLSYVFR